MPAKTLPPRICTLILAILIVVFYAAYALQPTPVVAQIAPPGTRLAAPISTPDKLQPTPTSSPELVSTDPLTMIDPSLLKSAPIILAAIALLIVLAILLQVYLLGRLRDATLRSVNQQDLALQTARESMTGALLKTEDGWRAVVEQVIADATGVPISIDGSAGVLDVAAEPHPKFTVITRTGQQIVITTDPRSLRKLKLIRRGDRVIDASQASRISHLDTSLLWKSILVKRNATPVTPPFTAHWYVVVRAADDRSRNNSRSKARNSSLSRKGRSV